MRFLGILFGHLQRAFRSSAAGPTQRHETDGEKMGEAAKAQAHAETERIEFLKTVESFSDPEMAGYWLEGLSPVEAAEKAAFFDAGVENVANNGRALLALATSQDQELEGALVALQRWQRDLRLEWRAITIEHGHGSKAKSAAFAKGLLGAAREHAERVVGDYGGRYCVAADYDSLSEICRSLGDFPPATRTDTDAGRTAGSGAPPIDSDSP